MKSIGMALSGGGSRGIAHLGILKAFDEAGLKISMMSGTSAGAIVGLFYCSGYSPDNIMEIIRETRLIKYVRPAISKSGLLKLESIVGIFKRYIKNDTFDDLNIPLVVSSTNIKKGKNKFFGDGSLIWSVLASCAVPVIFQPVKIGEDYYVDGGVLNNLPVEPLIGQCDVVVGSNCNPVSEAYEPGNMRSLLERSLLMAINLNTFSKREICDLFLEPAELKRFGGFDFSKATEIFEIGYDYGQSMSGELLKKL
jgi:NTE family protein